ncbi:hypothetical protein [Haladaptatus sp. NG-WS-4]
MGRQSESSGGRIVTIEQTGDAIITTVNETTYIWQSEQYTARATFQINTNEDQYSVCLHENRSDSEPRELDCRSKRVGNGSTATVTLTGANATETGERTLYFQLRPTFGRDVPTLDSRTIRQHVISKEGDEDTDGLRIRGEESQKRELVENRVSRLGHRPGRTRRREGSKRTQHRPNQQRQ